MRSKHSPIALENETFWIFDNTCAYDTGYKFEMTASHTFSLAWRQDQDTVMIGLLIITVVEKYSDHG